MGPVEADELRDAREASIEIAHSGGELPEGVRVHVKLDTGMGRYGISELRAPAREVVGLMSHLATADSDPAFAREQIGRFDELVRPYREDLVCHLANSAAALRLPESRFDAARCGIALYGLSPFGEDPAADGLEPVLSWRSRLAQVKLLRAGPEHRLRPPLRRRAADVDRPRPGRLRGRLSPRPHGHESARRRRACRGRRDGLDGLVRRRAAARAAGRDAGNADRRRPALRVARAHCWHDQLRDRDRHRLGSQTRDTSGGRSVSHDDAVRSRFTETAEDVVAHSRTQIEPLREELRSFLAPLRGDERVLDAGPARARSRWRSLRSSARSSASTSCRSCSRQRGARRPRT